MTVPDYDDLTDRFLAVAAHLDSARTMSGTKTLQGLKIAAYYLDLAKQGMAELSKMIEEIEKDNQ
jgi:hypothetical protein